MTVFARGFTEASLGPATSMEDSRPCAHRLGRRLLICCVSVMLLIDLYVCVVCSGRQERWSVETGKLADKVKSLRHQPANPDNGHHTTCQTCYSTNTLHNKLQKCDDNVLTNIFSTFESLVSAFVLTNLEMLCHFIVL